MPPNNGFAEATPYGLARLAPSLPMFCGTKALPTTANGMNAKAAHNAGRQRADSRRPSGNTCGTTKTANPTAGAYDQPLTHAACLPKGNERGEKIRVWRA